MRETKFTKGSNIGGAYDPRNYLAAAEKGMAQRVKQAVQDLRAEGTTLFKR